VPGAVAVGQGVAFNDGLPPDTWNIRAAYAGAADGIQDVPQDALGRLVTDGVISPDLFLRVEIADNAGNRSGSRPRFSTGGSTIVPPPAVVLDAVPTVPNAGGVCFDLRFTDVIADFYVEPGLYRITLTDSAGLKWTLWRPDAPDAQGPNAVVHVPFVGAGGTLPMAGGVLRCQISAAAWPALDLGRFLWSDIEREVDLFSHSRRRNITPP
jgi:hypothetical protein